MMTIIPRGTRRLLDILIFSLISFSLLSRAAGASDLGIIENADLYKNLSQWVLLDTRPKAEWLSGHIPGALSFSWEDYTKTEGKEIQYSIKPPQDLANGLGKMGISENTPLVVYADDDKSWGAEGWGGWVLAWLGHKAPVRLLAGGIRSWKDKKLPLTLGTEKLIRTPGQYSYRLDAWANISTAEIAKQGKSLTLIDTRSSLEWITGRIPGAVHIEWTKFYAGAERRPLSAEALKKLLRDNDADLQRPVVYYCAAGVRSGLAWCVHQLAGLSPARNYAGGWEAWKKDSSK